MFRQTEVEHFDAGATQQNIGRLEVPMIDAFGVCRPQRICDLERQAYGFLRRQRTAYRLSLDVFHNEVIRTDVEERADVGMIERRNGSRFPLEAFAELFFYDFDRNRTVEACITRLPYLSHAARANRNEDFVRSQPLSGFHSQFLIKWFALSGSYTKEEASRCHVSLRADDTRARQIFVSKSPMNDDVRSSQCSNRLRPTLRLTATQPVWNNQAIRIANEVAGVLYVIHMFDLEWV